MNLFNMLFPTPRNTPIKPIPNNNTVPDINKNEINYILNDPSTPELISKIQIPPKPLLLDFSVNGFTGKSGLINSPETQAANVYTTIANSIEYTSKVCERKLRWAATNKLNIIPRAGVDLNAYYDRSALKFFYSPNPLKNKMFYACDSVDIVAHELGHALLDCIKPNFYSIQSMEIWAFHEAFGDINALLTIMLYDSVIDYAIHQTNGNLRTSNIISKLAEEMGLLLFNLDNGKNGTNPNFLRNAVNSFKYVPPNTLPKNAPYDQLANEPHSFARIFVGAWYDALIGIYELEFKKMDPKAALKKARDIMASYTWKAIPHMSTATRFFEVAAKAILSIDRAAGSPYYEPIFQAFVNRNILNTNFKPMSKKLVKFNDSNIKNHSFGKILSQDKIKTIKLSMYMPYSVMSTSKNNPLYDVDIDVPTGNYYDLDQDGNVLDYVETSLEDSVSSAKSCINYIYDKDLLGNNKMFKIKNNKLIRNYIMCSFCGKNVVSV